MVWLLWAKSTKTKLEKIQSFSYFHWYYNWNQTVTYESSREVKMTLRDSNENVKNNRFRLTKQLLRTCTKLFCTFLCRRSPLWRELPNFTFHRQREHATTNFSFHPQLSLTQIGPTCAEGYHLVDVWQASLSLLVVSGPKILSPFSLPILPRVL